MVDRIFHKLLARKITLDPEATYITSSMHRWVEVSLMNIQVKMVVYPKHIFVSRLYEPLCKYAIDEDTCVDMVCAIVQGQIKTM